MQAIRWPTARTAGIGLAARRSSEQAAGAAPGPPATLSRSVSLVSPTAFRPAGCRAHKRLILTDAVAKLGGAAKAEAKAEGEGTKNGGG